MHSGCECFIIQDEMFLAIHFPFSIELNTSVQSCFENNKICVLLLLLKIVYHLAVCIVLQCTIFIGMIVLSKVRHIQFKTVRQNMLNIHFCLLNMKRTLLQIHLSCVLQSVRTLVKCLFRVFQQCIYIILFWMPKLMRNIVRKLIAEILFNKNLSNGTDLID